MKKHVLPPPLFRADPAAEAAEMTFWRKMKKEEKLIIERLDQSEREKPAEIGPILTEEL